MKEKDERFNKRLFEGSSKLSSLLEISDFIDPIDALGLLKELKALRGDAKNRTHKILYAIGIVKRELKDNLQDLH